MIIQIGPHVRALSSRNLVLMQQMGELCDVTVIVNGTQIKAHKCILAASCEYFRTSFRFDDKNSMQNCTIDLSHLNCDVKVVEKIIWSFYTHELDLCTKDVSSTLCVIDYFMCEELKHSVEEYMDKCLDFSSALLFFQLALQYNLNTTQLFGKAQSVLWFRFHDFFIYQPQALESNVDIIEAYRQYGFFYYCSPVQVIDFFCTNLNMAIQHMGEDGSYGELDQAQIGLYVDKTQEMFKLLTSVLSDSSHKHLRIWSPYVTDCLKLWETERLGPAECYAEFKNQIQKLLEWLLERTKEPLVQDDMGNDLQSSQTKLPVHDNFSKISTNAPLGQKDLVGTSDCGLSSNSSSHSSQISASGSASTSISKQMFNTEALEETPAHMDTSNCGEVRTPSHTSNNLGSKLDEIESKHIPALAEHSDQSHKQLADSFSASKNYYNILVALAPSAEMSSQIAAVDASQLWPLVRSPQLELSFYDMELKAWRQGCKFDFPIQGAMQEKHAWRIAFLGNSLYMFSLYKASGLEFNLEQRKWTHLPCQHLFQPHSEHLPVKSVVPIAVADELVVLSMSREAKTDGTFRILQKFFILDSKSKKFNFVSEVGGETMSMPMTQWTVHGNTLITVKASTIMHAQISQIQHIYVFDVKQRAVRTYDVVCAMVSKLKLVARDNMLYLFDKEGWCKSFDFDKAEFTGISRYKDLGLSTPNGPLHKSEVTYPALTRVTCHAGQSRWEITTSHDSFNARMQETHVNKQETLKSHHHPPPPFQFLTALCPGNMSRTQLNSLKTARFEFQESKNL